MGSENIQMKDKLLVKAAIEKLEQNDEHIKHCIAEGFSLSLTDLKLVNKNINEAKEYLRAVLTE